MKIPIGLLGMIGFLFISCTGQSQPVKNSTTEIQRLSHPEHKASSVYLTTDEKNRPAASWIEVDSTDAISLYYAIFDETTESFGQSIGIPIPEETEIREESMPKIAFKGDGSVFVLYQTSEDRDTIWGLTDLKFIQSTNQGKNWSAPQSVAPKDYEANKMSSYANIARLDDGEIGIVWLSDAQDIDITRPIKFTKTNKNGVEKDREIGPSGCECCRVSIATAANGKVGVAYRNIIDRKERDISIVHSFDNGKDFGKPTNFSGDHWEIYGCPVNGPSIAVLDDFSYVGWFTDSENQRGVNLAKLDNDNQVLENHSISKEGSYIQVGVTENKIPIAVYNEVYDVADSSFSKVLIAKIDSNTIQRKEVSPKKSQATTPVLSVISEKEVLVAWSDRGGVYYGVVRW